MSLIIINGHPGSGKTTLGRTLSQQLGVRLLSRDALKERMFDERAGEKPADMSDIEWSQQLGGESFDLMFQFVKSALVAGNSLIVESPFVPERHSEQFQTLLDTNDAQGVQILLNCDPTVLHTRFTQRLEQGKRHAAHPDTEFLHHFNEGERWHAPRQPLTVNCPLIEIDTTDFEAVDIDQLIAQLQALIAPTQ